MKIKIKKYLKDNLLHFAKNYLDWDEKDIEIRKRYEEGHKLLFNLGLAILLAIITISITTDIFNNLIWEITFYLVAISFLVIEVITILYHKETTRLMKKKK